MVWKVGVNMDILLTVVLVICVMWVLAYNALSYFIKLDDGGTAPDNGGTTPDNGGTTPDNGGTKTQHINSLAEQKQFLQNRYKGKLFEARAVEIDTNIGEFCPHGDGILFEHDAVLYNDRNLNHILRNVKCCDICNTVFVPSPTKEEIYFDIVENILYINQRIHNHQIRGKCVVSVTGVVRKIDGSMLKINVEYCVVCGKYFIEEQQYNRYMELYGILLGNFVYFNGFNFRYAPLNNAHSLLNLCGYNVSQKDNLSVQTRQKILRYVMEMNLMSKEDIISHLCYYINLNRNQLSKKIAVKKWKDDLDFVNTFRMNKQRTIDFR